MFPCLDQSVQFRYKYFIIPDGFRQSTSSCIQIQHPMNSIVEEIYHLPALDSPNKPSRHSLHQQRHMLWPLSRWNTRSLHLHCHSNKGGSYHFVKGRQALSWLAVRELGYSGVEVARWPGVTNSCVTRATSVKKGLKGIGISHRLCAFCTEAPYLGSNLLAFTSRLSLPSFDSVFWLFWQYTPLCGHLLFVLQ